MISTSTPDVAERGLDEPGGGIGPAFVFDGVQDDLEPQKTLKERRTEKRAAKKLGSGSLLRPGE